jgi:hypothetical protein
VVSCVAGTSQSQSFRLHRLPKTRLLLKVPINSIKQGILRLLQKAAGVAEANSHHALEMAQKLSHQLRAAEDRIAELEAEVGIYQDKADRAEQWLHKVYTEIEDRFLRQHKGHEAMTGAPQRKKTPR